MGLFIAQNQKPSHQAFQRFIHDDAVLSLLRYILRSGLEDRVNSIDTDVKCSDGTKYEATANKYIRLWRKNCRTWGRHGGRVAMILSEVNQSS
ncbi:hypothetical protein [Catenibacterium sp.]|uniref:hypothetical protein n=1 Tax=Catenibacterium sp. TaxID=2049022 RepID=UPI003995B445